MAEEKEVVEITSEVKDGIIKDYLASRVHIDNMNAEKGAWGDTYKVDKLPGLLEEARKDERAKVTLELQPEETELEKRLKALEQSNADKDRVIALGEMKTTLSSKAKEIGFDTDRAGRYSIYGENAEKYMVEDHEYMTTKISSELEKKLKGSVDSGNPQSSEKIIDDTGFESSMNASISKL